MTEADILTSKNRPTYIVKKNEKGILFGEGIEEPKGIMKNAGKLYLHDFRFKYTKVLA